MEVNKEKEDLLTCERLKELLSYDKETGVFIRIVPKAKNKYKIGSLAGTVSPQGYISIMIDGYLYLAHRLAWLYIHGEFPRGDKPYIDHINGKKDDNRIENLEACSQAENMRNRQMLSTNTSGLAGIQRVGMFNNSKKNPKINYYWRACWTDKNGKPHEKNFNTEKLGENQAKDLAIAYRIKQLLTLATLDNVSYSERHGNP